MKKTLTMFLALGLLLSLCACGSSKYVGIWKITNPNASASYMYIYKDGTGDSYLLVPHWETKSHVPAHGNVFSWKVSGGYFVKTDPDGRVQKYTLSGNTLLDKQGKVAYIKCGDNPSIDMPL